jgi:hypothetical protein
VVYRDVTRQAKGLYRLEHEVALKRGLAYLSRCNSGWFCHTHGRLMGGRVARPRRPACGAQSGARERAGAWCGSAEQSAVLARGRWGERRTGAVERLGCRVLAGTGRESAWCGWIQARRRQMRARVVLAAPCSGVHESRRRERLQVAE